MIKKKIAYIVNHISFFDSHISPIALKAKEKFKIELFCGISSSSKMDNISIKNLRIRNIDIWPIVRNTVILKYKDYNSKNSLCNVNKQSLWSIARLLIYGIIKFPFFTKNHKQVVFSSPFSTIKSDKNESMNAAVIRSDTQQHDTRL